MWNCFYIKSVRSLRIASVLLRKTVRRSLQIAVKASDFDPITLSANQRVFYSDDMIDQGYARKLNARFGVDENTKEITSVHLYARRDSNDNSAINGLDLTVSKSGTVYHQNGLY